MSRFDFYALISFIFAAQHTSPWVAGIISVGYLIAAIVYRNEQ